MRQLVDVGLNETRVKADVLRQCARLADRRVREIGPGNPCAQTGPAQGVESKVALQVEKLLSIDGSDLRHLVRPELVQAGLEVGDPVEVGPVIDAGPLVPEGAIGLEVLIHWSCAPIG